jgi:hypothetical protein
MAIDSIPYGQSNKHKNRWSVGVRLLSRSVYQKPCIEIANV